MTHVNLAETFVVSHIERQRVAAETAVKNASETHSQHPFSSEELTRRLRIPTASTSLSERVQTETDVSLLVETAGKQISDGDFPGAAKTANKIPFPKTKLRIFTHIVALLASQGKSEEVIQIVKSLYHRGWRDCLLKNAVDTFSSQGMFIKALETANAMDKEEELHHKVLSEVVGKMASELSFSQALSILETCDQDLVQFLLKDFAIALASLGKIAEAKQAIALISSPNDQNYASYRVSVALAFAGNIEEARKMAEENPEPTLRDGATLNINQILSHRAVERDQEKRAE